MAHIRLLNPQENNNNNYGLTVLGNFRDNKLNKSLASNNSSFRMHEQQKAQAMSFY
jgi:hypothetical protein